MDDIGSVQNADHAKAGRYNALFVTIGWIFAVLSLFIYPFIFGVLSVIMGILATKNGSKAGLHVIVASIIFMGLGLIFSPVLLNYLRHFFRA